MDKRRFVRMNTVFPVEIEVFGSAEAESTGFLQAFTRDVGRGGLCVELKSFDLENSKFFVPDARIKLTINPLFSSEPVSAAGRIAWIEKRDDFKPARYRFGVSYTHIDGRAEKRIFLYAKRRLWMPRVASAAGLVVVILLLGAVWLNGRLAAQNERLVAALIESAAAKSDITARLLDLQKRKTVLEKDLLRSRAKIAELEGALAAETGQKAALETELSNARGVARAIEEEFKKIAAGEKNLRGEYESLASAAPKSPSATREMAEWLIHHQNLRTGLVASFEGDASLEDWAFTYDQSLAAQVFLLFQNEEAAAKILSFYQSRAAKKDGAFYNAYDAFDGSPKESVIRTGPNVWMGLAALQYEHGVRDGRFEALARSTGDWTIDQIDAEGGIRGGPDVSWYSTEHNLDAYAFLSLLFRHTGDEKYAKAAERILAWIRQYAYSQKDGRLQRGKGDATIATDTFSWAIAAIDPSKLREIGWDPEAIVQFAEENCEVSVTAKTLKGKEMAVRGFDFSKAQNLGRGGVISTEWTAQMIVTYHVMARYFEKQGDKTRAELYHEKANFYFNELLKLLITSPSPTGQGRGCLPYASVENADTGHGWRTPKGRSTGSVAGTAYGFFAGVDYNPFELDNKKPGST